MASVIVRASGGFASISQRRGVTPFVLLLKRSGNISARSLTVVVRSSWEWIAATPFVLCEPTIARFAAMRIFCSGPSSTRLTRSTRPSSPGKRAPHVVEEPPVDLEDDLEVTRERRSRTTRAATSRARRSRSRCSIGCRRPIPSNMPTCIAGCTIWRTRRRKLTRARARRCALSQR